MVGMRFVGITVPGVCKAMGVEPDKRMMWSVGLVVMNEYVKRYGQQPPKDNRQKTYTKGVHCFAIYPEGMRPFIEMAIRSHDPDDFSQPDLFL